MSHGLTGADVGLQDAAQLFHGLWVLQDVHVLREERGRELTVPVVDMQNRTEQNRMWWYVGLLPWWPAG